MHKRTYGRKMGSTPYGYMLFRSPANRRVRMPVAAVLFSRAVGCLPKQSTSRGENLEWQACEVTLQADRKSSEWWEHQKDNQCNKV